MCCNTCTCNQDIMKLLHYTVYTIFLAGLVSVQASPDVLEAENAAFFEGKQVIPRSDASGQATLKIYKGQAVSIEFCLTKHSEIEVQNVWYSNDGESDLITVTVDNKGLGKVVTEPLNKDGEGWNIFRPSGPLGSIVYLSEGRHQISFYVEKGDEYGVEIDKIELLLHNGKEENSLDCKVFCFDDISYDHGIADTGFGLYTSKGKLVQKSKKTLCAEEDNIHIPIFHDSARKYIISANLPQYTSFANSRMADWENCKMTQSLWSFRDIELSQTQRVTQASGVATMSVTPLDTDQQSHLISYGLIIEFSLDGPSLGMMDSELGSIIKVYFRGIIMPVDVSMQYFGRRSQWSESTNKTVHSNKTWDTWNVPDFAWREGRGNSIRLTITAFKEDQIQIGEIVMDKRGQVIDQSLMAYYDGMTIIEVVDMDVWWRVNETMTLKTLNNGRVFQGVDYFRIYRKIPWSEKDFCQVFVMYQDGNVRLLPITPHGLDWIPFGSSILIGQSDHMAFRPAAPLRHADIDPKELTIQLTYWDGSFLSLKLDITMKETMVIVSDAVYARPLASYPFLTFRSMWVADGNADVDHVGVDGNEPHHILSGWETLRGTSYAFFRKCISKHNTLSPDLRVKIID
ncbi:hypothetical protein CHS0354_033296 [Potamilus streckersoni]|uniref:Uncharacterized protein n=1 Tax=Potamilus streckersoni TaxID=2493646 RepID=A0AAE0VJL2_9BIVA|nr:hypothetical protein CHS0354_033296 [Potamilus streckersoni]